MDVTSPGTNDISLELLRRDLPKHYHRWVLAGVLANLVGYSATTVIRLGSSTGVEILRYTDPYVLLTDFVALVLLRWRRPRTAAGLILAATWLDLQITILTTPNPADVTSLLIVPVFVLASGLLFGGRAAYVAAVLNAVSVPATIEISRQLGWGLGFFAPGSVLYVVTLEGGLLVTTVLVAVFLRAFAVVLRQSNANERRARELLENSPDGIISFSKDGQSEGSNRAAGKLLSLSEEEVIGVTHTSLPLEGEDDRWKGELTGLASQEAPITLRATRNDLQLEALVRPVTRWDGTEGLMVVLRDITKRVEAEARARELQGQLLHAQKMEAIGRLAGGIAHDFNNLLTGVSGYGTLLSESVDRESSEIGAELLAVQEKGASLIRQLLAFARKDVTLPKPMDLTKTLIEMVTLIERLLGERVRLDLHVRKACPIVADAGKIEQVILNLVANARDAMPDGGELYILCDATMESVILTIKDSGAGMSPEVQHRIFEPFFTTKAKDKGTGLGLSTVHGIVLDSGGTVEVESDLGKGTCFIIRWPRWEGTLETVMPAALERQLHGEGQSILVVEDNDTIRTFLTRLLTLRGYNVTVARTGERAIGILEEREVAKEPFPDFILTDVIMPGMTGPQLIREVQKRWRDFPFLLMSGYLGDDAENLGFDPVQDLIHKPFKAPDLLARISAKLEQA